MNFHFPLDVEVGYTDSYIYLGGYFTDSGKMSAVISGYAKQAVKHIHKLAMFVHKNATMPFHLKKKVLDAAFMSSILYSS